LKKTAAIKPNLVIGLAGAGSEMKCNVVRLTQILFLFTKKYLL